MSFIVYKSGIKISNDSLTGDAAIAINGNFKTIGDLFDTVATTTALQGLVTSKGCQFDGAGLPIANGSILAVQIPLDCTVIGWTIISPNNVSGSITIDVQTSTYAAFTPGAAGASIVGAGAKPAIAAAVKATSANLTSWSPNLNAGDYLIFVTSAVTALTQARIGLKLQPR